MDKLTALNMMNVGFMQFLKETEQEYNEMVEQERREPRAYWVRNWLKPGRRLAVGHYYQLMKQLRLDDQEYFYDFLRNIPPMFDKLLQKLSRTGVKTGKNALCICSRLAGT